MENNTMIEYISDQYKQLNKQRREHCEQYDRYVYETLPQIKEIDDEIACLAINFAAQVSKGKLTVDEALQCIEIRRSELIYQKNELMAKAGIKPYEPLPYRCSFCKDSGIVNGEKCVCYKKKVRQYMIDNAKKISSFSCDIDKDTFGALSMQYYDRNVIPKLGISPFEYMSGIVKKCREYCDNFGADSDNLFFSGEPGRGKTYMANCIANELLSKGYSVIYQTAYKLFQFLEDYKFGKLDRDSYEETSRAIYDCDMLIIDDLGTEYITAYTCSVFFDVINSRLLNNKKTLISTNLSMGDMAKNYTERVASRIKGEFNAMHFIGSDIRVLKRNAKNNGG